MKECDETKHCAHATPFSLGQAIAKSDLGRGGQDLVHGLLSGGLLDANDLQVARVGHAQPSVHLKGS